MNCVKIVGNSNLVALVCPPHLLPSGIHQPQLPADPNRSL